MDNPVKRGRGRPKVYSTLAEKRRAITESKTKYMLNKEWLCDACNRIYCLAGKHSHIKSNKHRLNVYNKENQ